MKKLTKLVVIATFTLLLRASVQAQNLTPVSSTTPNGIAATQLMTNSDTNSQTTTQSNSQHAQDKFDKTVPKNDKGSSQSTKNAYKSYAPRYGRNQTVLKH
jgi:hypothetical protein